MVLQNNGGDDLSVTADGGFTFATALASGTAYSVSVATQPSGQTCAVTNSSGTVGSADVTSVSVTCTTNSNTYTLGGAVSGLTGTVVLQNNGGDDLSVTADGGFTFATALAGGAAYSVSVATQPSGQTCAATNGAGTIGSANVTNVSIICTTNAPSTYAVGGTVSGLTGSLVLQNNGGDDLSVTADGGFTFATTLAGGAAYSVSVATQPTGQSCAVTNASGTVGSANVSSVSITCTTNAANTYTVGGTVSGLTGTVVLANNGSDSVSVVTDGGFTFATALASGAAYDVSVVTQPSDQSCTVTNGSGMVGSANVSDVTVTCSVSTVAPISTTAGGGGGGASSPILLALLCLGLAMRRTQSHH